MTIKKSNLLIEYINNEREKIGKKPIKRTVKNLSIEKLLTYAFTGGEKYARRFNRIALDIQKLIGGGDSTIYLMILYYIYEV